MARKRFWFIVSITVFSLGFFSYLGLDVARLYFGLQDAVSGARKIGASFSVQEFAERVSAPDPLVSDIVKPSQLSVGGIVDWTNRYRANAGLAPLKLNEELSAAAKNKVNDMFARQYFEHVSPAGEGPADIIKEAGYEYVTTGENLALGDFGTDQVLVKAWMDSPGHRANIMNPNFTEIGVAAALGTYEEKKTWLAVQEFGLSASVCPVVDSLLKTKIDALIVLLEDLSEEVDAARRDLEITQPKVGPEYAAKVQAYNALIARYNNTVIFTKGFIAQYNLGVEAFNSCVKKYTP